MKTDEIAEAIDRVGRRLNKNQPVPEDEQRINISSAYEHYGWGKKATPLPDDALAAIKLEDKSGDPRWEKHFRRSKLDIGVYRSAIGFYWCLRYEPAMGEHFLINAGSASDVVERYGN